MIVAKVCRFFSFERDWRPSVARSWTLAVEKKEFAGQSIGHSFTDLMAYWMTLWLSVTYTLLMHQRIALKFWRVDIYWPIRFVFHYFILKPKYFLFVDFRSYFSRMSLFYVFSWLVEKYKNVTWMFLSMFLLLIWKLI